MSLKNQKNFSKAIFLALLGIWKAWTYFLALAKFLDRAIER